MKLLSRTRILVATLTWCAVGGLHNAPAATTNLFPVADTYIRDTDPTLNFGSANPLLVGIAADINPPSQRCLFRFSLESVPSGAVISGATLRLIAVKGPREASDFDLNRLLVNWVESEATWNARRTGIFWGTPGAGTDFVAAPSATAVLAPVPVPVVVGGQPITNVFSSPGMVADLQMWLDQPGTNFGWILQVAGGQAGSGRQLASREHTSLKPVLTVEYISKTPTPAAPPTIFGTALEAGTIRFSFHAESNRTYTVEFRDALTAGNWAALTNIPAQPTDTTIQITNTLSSDARYFRARTP